MQVYLPDDLYDLVKKRRLPASELLQDAVRAEVRRRQLLEEGGFWHFAKRVCGHPASRQSSWWNAWKVTPVETPVRTGFSRLATSVPETLARRAALLRRRARRDSAVDALVVAHAEPAGTVLTSNPHYLEALAAHAESVDVIRV
jgi:hypothetical protein